MSKKTDGKVETGVSRRTMLKGTAAVAGLAAGTAIGGFPTIWAQDDITVRTVGMSVSNMPQSEDMANEALPFKVVQTAAQIPDIIGRGLNQPKSADLFEPPFMTMKVMWPSGNFQAWDTTKLPQWDQVVGLYKESGKIWPDSWYGDGQNPSLVGYTSGPDATDFVDPGSTKWITNHPVLHNADTLGIRPDVIGRPIDSWKELINSEFSGRAGLVAFPQIGLMDAAMAFQANGEIEYANKGNMTREEIDFSIDRLIQLKNDGHWRSLWSTFNDSVQLMVSGEVVIQSMWSPAVTAVREQGVPCIYQDLVEGYRSWSLGHCLPKHVEGKKLGAVYDYVSWYHSGTAGAFFARQGYYVVTWQNTKKYLPKAEWDFWFEGKPATVDIYSPFGKLMEKVGTVRDGGSYKNRMGRIAVWNSVMDENEYLTDRWNEFMAS
ncbi:MAG: substrate-binding domain-containing protein [Alphaproteobacteria bacterium]